MASIESRKLTKSYNRLVVCSGIDLTIADGEFVTLLGPSGCGKTTTLNMVAGLEDPTSGAILMNRQEVNERTPFERDIAMVFQNYALYPHMTAAENIGFTLKLRRMARAEIDKRVGEVARSLEIGHLLERYPSQMSGGQQQRIAIGRAMVREPQAFLFDEPFSNLDTALRVKLRGEVKRLHQRLRTTSIFVTHDQEEALSLSDRIAILRQGHVEQYDTPEAIYVRPATRYVAQFIGTPQLDLLDGTLVSEGGEPAFRVGERFFRLSPAIANTVSKAGAVQMAVRPEHIVLSRGEQAATVDLVQPVGPVSFVTLSWPGGSLTARVPGMSTLRTGAPICFDAEPADLMFFAVESGRRVEMP